MTINVLIGQNLCLSRRFSDFGEVADNVWLIPECFHGRPNRKMPQ